MTSYKLSCITHTKRIQGEDGNSSRPPAPPMASFVGSTWDRSGSMSSMRGTPGQAFYKWAVDACTQAEELGQDCFLFASTFDNVSEIRLNNVHHNNVKISIDDANDWTEPRGRTKLYDTAVEDVLRIRRAAQNYKNNLPREIRNLNPHIVIAWSLMTDGMDNASEVADQEVLAYTVREARDAGCLCYFLAANCNGVERGREYGFDAEKSLTFGSDERSSANAFKGMSQCLRVATSGSQDNSIPTLVREASTPAPQTGTVRTAPWPHCSGRQAYYESLRR